jgi:predicted RNA-binding Zn ribbon-like protein
MTPSAPAAVDTAEPLFIADEVALDFVNTAYGVEPDHRECFTSDQDVLDWLKRAELLETPGDAIPAAKRGAVLSAAIRLRESAQHLIERRKAGSSADPAALNEALSLGSAHLELIWKKGQPPKLRQHRAIDVAEAVLVPVAEAVARLLADADFELVRKCESTDCTLWFYDRTKSHHRRWCSMAMCGNRAKVAAFRARQKGD